MDEKTKTISITTLITLGLISLSMLPGLLDSPKYYCDQRPELGLVHCDSFSKYVAENGKCIQDDGPNYICRQGWLEVIDDTIIESDGITYQDNVNREEYMCNNDGCEELI